jgi:hypothetical protein
MDIHNPWNSCHVFHRKIKRFNTKEIIAAMGKNEYSLDRLGV